MQGTFDKLVFDQYTESPVLNTVYVMRLNSIVTSGTKVTVPAFRAYFVGPKWGETVTRDMRILVEDSDGAVTDITELLQDQLPKDSQIYDLSGRRVFETVPGHIYLRNGQKYIAQ